MRRDVVGDSNAARRHTSQRLEWTRCLGRCSGLPLKLKALAWAIGVFMDAGGTAAPGIDRIGETMSASPSTVQRLRPQLVATGWIEHSSTRGGRHQTSVYRASIPIHLCERVSARKPVQNASGNLVRSGAKPVHLGDQGSTEVQDKGSSDGAGWVANGQRWDPVLGRLVTTSEEAS